jgi:hypothetical protein
MTYQEIIDQGIAFREQTEPEKALACFGQAMILEPDSAAAFNNYGNTLRELGFPLRSIPFLQHACILDPDMSTAQFNLAVAMLIGGNLRGGMRQYESRWKFEHLDGLLPNYSQPVWTGQDIDGKSILIVGEQGHGDIFQFCRFVENIKRLQPKKIYLQVVDSMIDLLKSCNIMENVEIGVYDNNATDFDYWAMIMSLPIGLDLDYQTLNSPLQYINASPQSVKEWQLRLGPKTQQRIGIFWSGRRDTWINRHKAVKFENIIDLIQRNPGHQWINLQADATEEENQKLTELGVCQYPGAIRHWGDTAGLIHHLDLVIGVDTAIGHLAGAMGRPTWIMLSHYALDWRWLLDRNDSPWYPSVKLFRQPKINDWDSAINQLCQYLAWWKN